MSCLFNALTRLTQIKDSRGLICDFMTEYPDAEVDGTSIDAWLTMVAQDMHITKQQYLARMRQSSTWGGAPEMFVFSYLFNVRINVMQGTSNKCISSFYAPSAETRSHGPVCTLVLDYLGRMHYEPRILSNDTRDPFAS